MIKTDAIIIGAGPTGLFAVHQLGIIGLKCEIIDNLNRSGGQCQPFQSAQVKNLQMVY
jgi:thioredoxin reductase (NADPH)